VPALSLPCPHSPLESLHSPLEHQSGIRYQPCCFSPPPDRGSNPGRPSLRLALYCHHLRPSVYYGPFACSGFTPGTSAHRAPRTGSVKSISQIHQTRPVKSISLLTGLDSSPDPTPLSTSSQMIRVLYSYHA
jgi:hypothetical protein